MATIVMESSKVIEACETVITHIMDERAKRDEVTINTLMQHKRFSFKRGFYNMNREETIAFIKGLSWLDAYGFSQYAYGELDKAKNILRLARLGDPVTLNDEDCRVLF